MYGSRCVVEFAGGAAVLLVLLGLTPPCQVHSWRRLKFAPAWLCPTFQLHSFRFPCGSTLAVLSLSQQHVAMCSPSHDDTLTHALCFAAAHRFMLPFMAVPWLCQFSGGSTSKFLLAFLQQCVEPCLAVAFCCILLYPMPGLQCLQVMVFLFICTC